MHQLFSVGEVARHQNISRQTLIFYVKILITKMLLCFLKENV